jgi:hypothetical protein
VNIQEPTRCLGKIPPPTTANVTGNTTFPTFVEGELQLTQTLDGHKVTPGREFFLSCLCLLVTLCCDHRTLLVSFSTSFLCRHTCARTCSRLTEEHFLLLQLRTAACSLCRPRAASTMAQTRLSGCALSWMRCCLLFTLHSSSLLHSCGYQAVFKDTCAAVVDAAHAVQCNCITHGLLGPPVQVESADSSCIR